MNIFKDDLLKNKYFISIVVVLVLFGGVIWFINFNSLESRCKRYVQGLGNVLGGGERFGMRNLRENLVSDPLVQKCIDRGGP